MNSDLKKELEKKVPDSEIPPLSMGSIKNRGRRLQWRRRAAVTCSVLLVATVLSVGTMTLVDEPRDPELRPPIAQSTTGDSTTGDSTANRPIVVPRNAAVSLKPNIVRPDDRARLTIHRAFGGYGLRWVLERQVGSSWEWAGLLEAGPGKEWEERFDLPPLEHGDIEDIGFGGTALMLLEIPDLQPGRYRLGQDFSRRGRGSSGGQDLWRYAEFEVIE